MTERLPDLDDLATLVLVAETGSLGEAARRLGLSQPSLSRRMTALERRLQVRVLRRSRRGTALTPEGQVLVDWAATLLAAAEDFGRSVRTLRAQGEPAVRAAVSMTLAEHHAPHWLGALGRRGDGSVPAAGGGPLVALTVANSTEVADLVEAGGAELGFVETPHVRPGLSRRLLGTDVLVVAVAPTHPWAVDGSVGVAELAATELLVREAGSGTRETLEQALRARGLRLRPALEVASNTALTSAAVAGMGPVVLSGVALTDELALGQLVRVTVPGLDLSRPFTAIWRPGEPLSSGAATLLAAATAGRPADRSARTLDP